ncbi:MAG: DUF1232 domain-containing protein [Desulfobacteraceae bacterium]|nr:MAG: DUF1232 domain-containing protein [Desulfobacteraceae bacterium]
MKILFTILALLYALSPYDFLPDIAIGWGWLDDLIILSLLWWFFYSARRTVSSGQTRSGEQQFYGSDSAGSHGRSSAADDPAQDPYALLGIQRGASAQEIKQAYRKLANQYHPDKVHHLGEEFKALAEKRFREIEAAYRKLTKKQPNR